MVTVQLYAHHLLTTSRQQFQRDAARSREEVQGCSALEVDIARQYVEDVLLGKVRGGSCLERTWDIEMPSFIYACDDSHFSLAKRYSPFTYKAIKS